MSEIAAVLDGIWESLYAGEDFSAVLGVPRRMSDSLTFFYPEDEPMWAKGTIDPLIVGEFRSADHDEIVTTIRNTLGACMNPVHGCYGHYEMVPFRVAEGAAGGLVNLKIMPMSHFRVASKVFRKMRDSNAIPHDFQDFLLITKFYDVDWSATSNEIWEWKKRVQEIGTAVCGLVGLSSGGGEGSLEIQGTQLVYRNANGKETVI